MKSFNSSLSSGVLKMKNAVVTALDSTITSLRALINKSKKAAKEKLPSLTKIKDYLSSTKQKMSSIKSLGDLRSHIEAVY